MFLPRHLRWFFFVVLVGSHAALAWLSPEGLAPLIAGSLYLPLLPLQAIGLPVFATGESGGWPAPSVLGWALALLVWLALWWAMATLLARLLARHRI